MLLMFEFIFNKNDSEKKGTKMKKIEAENTMEQPTVMKIGKNENNRTWN